MFLVSRYWPEPAMLIITQIGIGIGNGLASPVSSSYLSLFATKDNAAQTLAFGSIADSIGGILGPFLTQLFRIDSYLPFWVAAAAAWSTILVTTVLTCIGLPKYAKEKVVKNIGPFAELFGNVKASDFSDAPDDEIMPLVTKQYHPEVAVLADYMQSKMEAQGHMWFYTRAGHDVLSKLGHVRLHITHYTLQYCTLHIPPPPPAPFKPPPWHSKQP
jgi:MFS family permease